MVTPAKHRHETRRIDMAPAASNPLLTSFREELEGGPPILRLLARTVSTDQGLYGSDALAAVQASPDCADTLHVCQAIPAGQ